MKEEINPSMYEEDVSLHSTRQGNLKSHMDLAVAVHNNEQVTCYMN